MGNAFSGPPLAYRGTYKPKPMTMAEWQNRMDYLKGELKETTDKIAKINKGPKTKEFLYRNVRDPDTGYFCDIGKGDADLPNALINKFCRRGNEMTYAELAAIYKARMLMTKRGQVDDIARHMVKKPVEANNQRQVGQTTSQRQMGGQRQTVGKRQTGQRQTTGQRQPRRK